MLTMLLQSVTVQRIISQSPHSALLTPAGHWQLVLLFLCRVTLMTEFIIQIPDNLSSEN